MKTAKKNFQLLVKMKPPRTPMTLSISDVISVCRLWINGKLVHEDGLVSDQAEKEIRGNFGIFCLLWGIQFMAGGSYRWMIFFLIPDIRQVTAYCVESTAYFYTISFMLFFLRSLFPKETPSFLPKIYFVLALRFSKAFTTAENLSDELQEKDIALFKLDKLKDEFLANTSHELRTPLNRIIGIAELINEGVFGKIKQKIRDNLALIIASARRLSSLINDILNFSHIKNRELSMNKSPVNIRILDETILEISVIDTGIGIAEVDIRRIFNSFEQVQSSGSRTFEGTGLGLSTTKQLEKTKTFGKYWLWKMTR